MPPTLAAPSTSELRASKPRTTTGRVSSTEINKSEFFELFDFVENDRDRREMKIDYK